MTGTCRITPGNLKLRQRNSCDCDQTTVTVLLHYWNGKTTNIPAIAFSCLDTTSMVFPASLSDNSSPMQAITFNPSDKAWATFSPIN